MPSAAPTAARLPPDALLSVVMPCYRLGAAAGANAEEVCRALEGMDLRFEVVPVDDGSGDETGSSLLSAAGRCSEIRPVVLPRNGGKGAALKAGVAHAKGDLILLLDGDLDIAIDTIGDFLETMREKDADIVVGSKRHPKSIVSYPWHRRIASACYFAMVRLLTGVSVSDTQAGMKLFRRETLVYALERMLVKTYAFDLEILAIARENGAKIAEAPIKLSFHGVFGCMRPSTVIDMVRDTLAVFYRLRILRYYRSVHVPQAAAEPPSFTVVIACPAPSAMLFECLEALEKQTFRDFEAIVLPDGACEIPLNATYPLRIIPTGHIRPAEKRNIGIREAKGTVVAFIDDDAYPACDWLEKASIYFGDDSIGAVGGPGATPPGDGFLARAGGRVYENVFVSGNFRYRYVAGLVRRDVDDYPSCNLFVRTALLREIGGYRTDFWPGEDTLLCEDIVYRMKKRIVYDPWTVVYHHRRRLFGPHLKQLTRYALHRGYFAKRHPKTSLKLSYFIPTLFTAYLATALFVHAWWYLAPLGVYAALVAASTFSFNPAMWLATALGVAASHIGYGIRFAIGLAKRKMPCEYRGIVES